MNTFKDCFVQERLSALVYYITINVGKSNIGKECKSHKNLT